MKFVGVVGLWIRNNQLNFGVDSESVFFTSRTTQSAGPIYWFFFPQGRDIKLIKEE